MRPNVLSKYEDPNKTLRKKKNAQNNKRQIDDIHLRIEFRC